MDHTRTEGNKVEIGTQAGIGLLMATKNDLNMFAFLNQLSTYFVNSSFSVIKYFLIKKLLSEKMKYLCENQLFETCKHV